MMPLLRVIWKTVRRTLRRVWASRGGGYYGLVVAITFVYLVLIAIAAALWPIQWLSAFGVGPTLLALLGATWVTYRITRPAILRMLEPDVDELDEIEAQAAAARLRGSGGKR